MLPVVMYDEIIRIYLTVNGTNTFFVCCSPICLCGYVMGDIMILSKHCSHVFHKVRLVVGVIIRLQPRTLIIADHITLYRNAY
jgi:hypothetical protein